MADRSVTHSTFVVEKIYPAAPARVFAAWADPAVKARWFNAPNEGTKHHALDFRVGGKEVGSGIAPTGKSYRYDAIYQDIVPATRIVYTYDMHVEDRRISVSLTSIAFEADGEGTRMTVTEHGAFLDGLDTVAEREDGTRWLLDQLGAEIERQQAA